ncbi:ABC transporter substrate-binding protein [Dactylosporangium sp. NPDC005572]|uniref:ABC transporter substrate-binding protein n=1 Tax=Dactylosporangium sp. NPDC005572 TaxID=3156889 RepID=UPI0033AC1536
MSQQYSRRTFLAGAAGVVGLTALAACGDTSSPTPGADSSTPKKGGRLRVGSIGGATDMIDPHYIATDSDQQRCQNLYDGLKYLSPDLPFHTEYGLAESVELAPDATGATIRLKQGVEFHHGKTLSADDLIFTFQRILNPAKPGKAAAALAAIDLKSAQKLDERTVRFTFSTPDSLFAERFGPAQSMILPTDYDPAKPVGTGPFKLQSFTPGARAVFVANPNYFVEGQPYLEQLEIISFANNESRSQALLAGQIDAVDSIDPALAAQFSTGAYRTMTTKSGFYQPLVMRVDKKPFDDPNVRLAFKLIVDREAMLKQAYSGLGSIGNDMPHPATPGYPDLPQRKQDIEQAKSLLRAAGYGDGLTVNLQTSAQNGGMVDSAQVFAQQAAAAGVTVKIDNVDASSWTATHKAVAFKQNYWSGSTMGQTYAQRFLPTGGSNDSGWNDADGIAIYKQLLSTVDAKKQAELQGQLLQRFYDSGPEIVHVFKANVDVYSSKVSGFKPFEPNGWSLGAWRYRQVWMA